MEKYISRCIQLAKSGMGSTFPNPTVGSVIVHDDSIIGEGVTQAHGSDHAEVQAIKSVKDRSLLSKATLYVTLEPCSHHGKTPPCADLIIANGIPKVVIGTLDPSEKVAGKGVLKLRGAGVEVITGVLEKQCREHHKRFLCFHQKKRPYIILKWAETKNGFMAPSESIRTKPAQPYWITNELSRQLVHKWRSEEQAILVGTSTVLADNPKLNARLWHGAHPIRIVLDRNLKINDSYHVLDGSIKTLILTAKSQDTKNGRGTKYESIDFEHDLPEQICQRLREQDIISVIIEGGKRTLQTFLDAGLWDEARVFTGSIAFENGLKAPNVMKSPKSVLNIQGDTLKIYMND